MESVYVTGHRNPDTDSIVSAMAYAALRNALGEREYIPARLGHISDETQLVLRKFGFEPPMRIHTMRTQVHDLDFDTPPLLDAAVTVGHAWSVLQENPSLPSIPVVTPDGHLFEMLSASDITSFDIQSIEQPVINDVPMFNLLSVLEGHILNDSDQLSESISGEVVIALPKAHNVPVYTTTECILICGQQPDVIRKAIEDGVQTIILCQAEPDDDIRVNHGKTCIISTPLDAMRAARLIYHSTPLNRICKSRSIPAFHLTDFVDDVQEIVLKNRFRSYPILDDNDKVVGTLSRFHLLKPRRKKIVLVDHNEVAQSVPGLEQANILGIIDHHRLADIQTMGPVFFRNEPVGSTATIISGMYQEKGIMPTEKMAGLLVSAIVADTVMFKSPTCTERDRRMAECMARIAGISLDELGREIFAVSANEDKPAKDMLFTDFKEFHIAGHNLGIAQITCINSDHLMERSNEFLDLMRTETAEKGYDMMLLMLTDVLREGTQLLFVGDEETIHLAFNASVRNNTCFLPKVLSRKKQIVPMLSLLWG